MIESGVIFGNMSSAKMIDHPVLWAHSCRDIEGCEGWTELRFTTGYRNHDEPPSDLVEWLQSSPRAKHSTYLAQTQHRGETLYFIRIFFEHDYDAVEFKLRFG